jgi:hypothetical protein
MPKRISLFVSLALVNFVAKQGISPQCGLLTDSKKYFAGDEGL